MRVSDAPPHHNHQEKAKEQKGSSRQAILNPDRLVVC